MIIPLRQPYGHRQFNPLIQLKDFAQVSNIQDRISMSRARTIQASHLSRWYRVASRVLVTLAFNLQDSMQLESWITSIYFCIADSPGESAGNQANRLNRDHV